MVKRALLIGCNYPGAKDALKGCVNDVNRMKRCLLERFRFVERDIVVMIDTDKKYPQPTGANIRKALSRIVKDSKSGDYIFVYFSGHGNRKETQLPDNTGHDERIVPTDGNTLSDDDFRKIVNELPHGVTFTFVADSCHSGGLIDHATEQIGSSTIPGGRIAGGVKPVQKDAPEKPVQQNAQTKFRGERIPMQGLYEVRNRSMSTASLMDFLRSRFGANTSSGLNMALYSVFGKDASLTVQMFAENAISRAPTVLNMVSKQDKSGTYTPTLEVGRKLLGHEEKALEQHASAQRQQPGLPSNKTGSIGGAGMGLLQNHTSGGGDKFGSKQQPTQNTTPIAQQVPQSGNYRQARAGSKPDKNERVKEDMSILISGCQSKEEAKEVVPVDKDVNPYGALTNAILEVLDKKGGSISCKELVLAVRAKLKDQNPGLYCSNKNVDAPFIC